MYDKSLTRNQNNELGHRLAQALFGDNKPLTPQECQEVALNVVHEFEQELSEAQVEEEMKKQPEGRNSKTFDSVLSTALKQSLEHPFTPFPENTIGRKVNQCRLCSYSKEFHNER